MKSSWNDAEAALLNGDLLKLRVYTSRLLGSEEDLVLHGGGNTSVKAKAVNIFGEEEDIIYVKGSGWDLATIEEAGFAPVKLKALQQMAELDAMSDQEMVRQQRMAMTNPAAPTPSVEAILHAIIPFAFVDHTHTDAVVTITNTPGGEEKIREIYGEDMLVVPYIMPGFVLAREVYRLTRQINWDKLTGIILLNHGVFSFDDDARKSYEKMISIVTKAEEWLAENKATGLEGTEAGKTDHLSIARLRKHISGWWKKPVLAQLNPSPYCNAFSELPTLPSIASRGPLTPDHIIRTKRIPMLVSGDMEKDLADYAAAYTEYFNRHSGPEHICLDKAPRWAIWPGHGVLAFGSSLTEIRIIQDITRHTMKAIYQAEQLGGWVALPQKDLFEVEYWSLEQEKLKKAGAAKAMQGRIALVSGAASGIGKACVEALCSQGAVVAALDINPALPEIFNQPNVLPVVTDVTDSLQVKAAIEATVAEFGGLDLVVSNAGIFPKSLSIGEMDDSTWNKSMELNVTSHQRLLSQCLPYLEQGIDPAVVIIASKNVPAPGPGASAYSVAKAGLTQLGRIAAMEFAAKGIRVNMVHPNAVYDTGIWTEEVLAARAAHYGLTVEEYKANNLLKVEIGSADVAGLVVAMLGPVFSKITGAQIPIDGGNDRTI